MSVCVMFSFSLKAANLQHGAAALVGVINQPLALGRADALQQRLRAGVGRGAVESKVSLHGGRAERCWWRITVMASSALWATAQCSAVPPAACGGRSLGSISPRDGHQPRAPAALG